MAWVATEEQYRVAYAAELGLVTLLDEQIGRILDALERTGLAEDTVVVFTSDHGDMFGDHGMMLKHFTHYRGVTHVPFVVRLPPRLQARRRALPGIRSAAASALVSNADLVPTLLELTGVPGHRGIQGRSLVPLLRGEADVHRSAVVVEEDQPFGLDGLPAPVHIRSVISSEGRYTRYFGTDLEELYLFATDPSEEHNVAARPEHAAALHRMRALLLDELLALTDHGFRVRAAA